MIKMLVVNQILVVVVYLIECRLLKLYWGRFRLFFSLNPLVVVRWV